MLQPHSLTGFGKPSRSTDVPCRIFGKMVFIVYVSGIATRPMLPGILTDVVPGLQLQCKTVLLDTAYIWQQRLFSMSDGSRSRLGGSVAARALFIYEELCVAQPGRQRGSLGIRLSPDRPKFGRRQPTRHPPADFAKSSLRTLFVSPGPGTRELHSRWSEPGILRDSAAWSCDQRPTVYAG